jgi:hypothetical protein
LLACASQFAEYDDSSKFHYIFKKTPQHNLSINNVMTSAFDCANTSLVLATSSSPSVAAISEPQEEEQLPATAATAAAAESETEDEEIKMNCVGGVRGMEESDVNTTDHSNCESDDDEEEEEESNNGEEEEGVVSFVTGHLRGALPLVRPKATPPPQRPTLSPHMEGQEEMETSGNSSSDNDEEDGDNVNNDDEASTVASDKPSVGARGVALSFGTPSGFSDADASSSENDDDEDSDVEDMESGPLANKNSLVEPAALRAGTRLGDQDLEDKKQDIERELLSMNEVLGQSLLAHDMDDSEAALDHLLGVVHDRDEFINLPKTKRVLSFNTLAALNAETGRSADSPKRLKANGSLLSTAFMPDFCLGAPAVEHEQIKMNFRIEARRESPIISSSDEEDLDGQLRDELDPHADDEKSIGRDNSPVPLLTPPGSPLTIEIDGGGTTTVCEWPSNLAVDNAMRAAADQEVPEVSRSMSPDVTLQEEDSDNTLSGSSSSQAVFDTSTLTPLLQGISVGNHR